jgi:hypothetical protein
VFFDRHTGVVAHVLAGSGQRVEQSGLAAIRVAGQGDADLAAPLSQSS